MLSVPLEKTLVQRGWQDLPASKPWRVFCISDELLNTPAPILVQGLQALVGYPPGAVHASQGYQGAE